MFKYEAKLHTFSSRADSLIIIHCAEPPSVSRRTCRRASVWSVMLKVLFILSSAAASLTPSKLTTAFTDSAVRTTIFDQCILGHNPCIVVEPLVDRIAPKFEVRMSGIFMKPKPKSYHEFTLADAVFKRIMGILPKEVMTI